MNYIPYETGQVRNIFPFIHRGIQQFILGGPADGDEAQLLCKEFPWIKATGFEPNLQWYEYQRSADFPGELRTEALLDVVGESYFTEGSNLRSSRVADEGAQAIKTVTLDSLFAPAPVGSIALWIDIEHSEMKALRGADTLLNDGSIDVLMVEAMYEEEVIAIRAHMDLKGYKEVLFYNSHDYIFQKQR